MEWGLVTCGGRGRMVNKRPWAATPTILSSILLLSFFSLHRIMAITNGKGKGVSLQNDDVKLLKSSLEQLDKILRHLSRSTCHVSVSCPDSRVCVLCPVQAHLPCQH